MKAIRHKVTHIYQPTNTTCGYTSVAMLLAHYGKTVTVNDLLKQVPHPKDEKGNQTGSVTAQLVAWCQGQGIKTHMYSFDCLVLDLSWKNLSTKEILAKLKAAKGKRDAIVFGRHWADIYIDAYIDMLEAGGTLTIRPLVTTKLLYKLLESGPIFVNICSTAKRGVGRTRDIGLRKSVVDDVKGDISTHSIVVYGNDETGNFLVADPWEGLIEIDPETMLCSITAAQIMCDNQCFVIEK